MKVHWTDRAKARLHSINDYLTEQNPQAAKKVTETILRRSAKLANPPEIGHKVKGYENTDLREVLARPYRLIYRVKTDQVDIATVLHYRQLLPTDLD